VGMGETAFSSRAARTEYREALQVDQARHAELVIRDRRWYAIRIVSFLLGVGLLGIGYFAAPTRLPWILPGWSLLAIFLFAIVMQQHVADAIGWLDLRQAVLRRRLARLERRWSDLPIDHPVTEATDSATAHDLDLFGRASLFQLVSAANTQPGRDCLARWLTDVAPPDEIVARQTAVQRLAGLSALRMEFAVRGLYVGSSTVAPEKFAKWVTGAGWLAHRGWLLGWARCAIVLWIALLASGAFGWLPLPVVASVGAVVIGINLLITVGFGGRVHEIFLTATGHAEEIAAYEELFALAEQLPSENARLESIRKSCIDPQQGARGNLAALRRLAFPASLWRSALWFLVYLCLQLTVLWDVHVLERLECWQARCQPLAARWFEALGELEALASLAGLSHDYPDWAWPDVGSPTQQTWTATALAHPLLGDDERVANDVRLGPRGELLLVTGSNMSGKSTLLRAIGTNTVLAQAGGPVCAAALRMPHVRLATSIRIRDSLADGVSFYMAELQRLRQVIELARTNSASPVPGNVLYLLDEILRGTNSGERQVAVLRVLAALRACKAFGAITTHDLELAGHPGLPQPTIVHFREHFVRDVDGRPTMTFDYRMQPGVCPTTNALQLLEIVGLDLPELDGSASRRSPAG